MIFTNVVLGVDGNISRLNNLIGKIFETIDGLVKKGLC